MFRALLLTVLLGLTACSAAPDAPSSPAAPVGQEKAKAALSVTPGSGEGVSPAGPFEVGVTGGTLTAVALTGADGRVVQGSLAGGKWVATEDLGYDKAYTWSGSARGEDGAEVPVTGSFRTVKPQRLINASMNVGDHQTYGIAMPIAVKFNAPVTDKASVQKAMKVTTSVPTEGAWAWLSDREAHWRPKDYWKPNTQVTVDANVYGVPFGNGAYGAADVHVQFAIADRALVVKADTATHRFIIFKDGVQLHDFPASYGLETNPQRVTHGGIHVVQQKEAKRTMTETKFGYKDVPVTYAVLILGNGEFVHEYARSMGSQGKENVSHGCANLSPADAKTFFDLTMIGDPVDVLNSSIPVSAADGDYYDWSIDWPTWLSKSA